jgi:hypothetical protein
MTTTSRTYKVRVTRTVDEGANAEMAAAGFPVPTLDDGTPNEEILTVEATRDGLANTMAMARTSLRFQGHANVVEEIMEDGTYRRLYIA